MRGADGKLARLRLVENAGFQFVGRVPRREEREDLGCRLGGCTRAGRHSSVAPPLTLGLRIAEAAGRMQGRPARLRMI